jgi:hypothetical protein
MFLCITLVVRGVEFIPNIHKFMFCPLRQRRQTQKSQGPNLCKIDSLGAKFSENFKDFVEFSINCQFIAEGEGPQK